MQTKHINTEEKRLATPEVRFRLTKSPRPKSTVCTWWHGGGSDRSDSLSVICLPVTQCRCFMTVLWWWTEKRTTFSLTKWVRIFPSIITVFCRHEHYYLCTALQVQHQWFCFSYSHPHLGPTLPLLLHLQVATQQAVFCCQRWLPLNTTQWDEISGRRRTSVLRWATRRRFISWI